MDRKFRQQFRQMQCLQALHEDLALPASLPPTGGKAASADFLKLVADLVREEKPAVVVECGSGLSTVVIARSEEHTSELQSLMRISYAVFCLKKKKSETHTCTT